MKRALFASLAGLSLLMCVASAALWVRSYSGSDYISRTRLIRSDPQAVVSHGHQATWTRGDLRLTREEHTGYPGGAPVPPDPAGDPPVFWSYGRLGRGHVGWEKLPVESWPNRLGFHTFSGGMSASFMDERHEGIAVPAWLPVAAFGVLPLIFVVGVARRRRRRGTGRCARCGYDLRASPDRCPECGAANDASRGADAVGVN